MDLPDIDFAFMADLPGAPPLPAFSLVSPGSVLTDYVPQFTVGGRDRSGKWPKVSKDFLRRNPECVCCGRRAVVTHHAKPYHLFPALELDPDNLMPTCNTCHLAHLHAGDYRLWVEAPWDVAARQLVIVRRAIETAKREAVQ